MSTPYHVKPSAGELLERLRGGDDGAPLSAMIEIADRCNEVCVHCYQVQGQKGELETSDWKRILDELADLGVLFLTISGGEATLRKDFLELCRYARDKKFAVKLYTNGLTMTEALANELGALAVQEVQLSLYSPRAEVHDWVTGVKRSWTRAVDGVRFLRKAGVPVVLKTPLMSFNVDDLDDYIALATELGCDYSFDPHLDPREDGDRAPQSFGLTDAQQLAVQANTSVVQNPPPVPTGQRQGRVCGACRGAIHVEANGEMRPCTQLDVSVGHALTDGVQKAWREDEAGLAIRSLTWADLHGCRDCALQAYCHRCFANARTEGGDALGPYASACHMARLQYRLVHGALPSIDNDLEGRDPKLGPYAEKAPGAYRTVADRLTDEDRARRVAHGWIEGSPASSPTPIAQPGKLVQLRRPGAKKSKPEVVPSASKAAGDQAPRP